MTGVKLVATVLMLILASVWIPNAFAAEPEAERVPFRLLQHKTIFGGGLTNTKVFFNKLPDPLPAICEGRAVDKPEAIESEMQLAAAIESDVIVGRIAKQVDFTNEQLILIAWKGNAAESMKGRVDGKGDAQQIVFSAWNSHTDAAKLAKNHVYFFVVAKDAKWKFEKAPQLQVCPSLPEPPLPFPAPGPNVPQLNGA